MSRATYSARVMRFRQGVYGARGKITPGAQVLLLRLSDSMGETGIVSIPRSRLAAEFTCDPSRITEWIKQARGAGFLDLVKRARPGTTAVYQGLYVRPEVRESAPLAGVRKTAPEEVRESAPLDALPRCARAVPQVVNAERESERPEQVAPRDEERIDDKAEPKRADYPAPVCGVHHQDGCLSTCPDRRREVS